MVIETIYVPLKRLPYSPLLSLPQPTHVSPFSFQEDVSSRPRISSMSTGPDGSHFVTRATTLVRQAPPRGPRSAGCTFATACISLVSMESKRQRIDKSEFVRLIPTNASEVRRVEEEKNAPCALSAVDCASGITLSDDKRTASSRHGYRTVRGVRGVAYGCYYYESKVLHLGETGAVRVGVQTQWADLHGPVGIDQHGYGVCSVNGHAVCDSIKSPMGKAFGEGDVVGVALFLPDANVPRPKTRTAVTWGKGKGKKKTYWAQEPPGTEAMPVPGSFVEFFVNGVPQGRMENLRCGTYFPAISLFTSEGQPEPAVVRCAFTEDTKTFRYPMRCQAWSP